MQKNWWPLKWTKHGDDLEVAEVVLANGRKFSVAHITGNHWQGEPYSIAEDGNQGLPTQANDLIEVMCWLINVEDNE